MNFIRRIDATALSRMTRPFRQGIRIDNSGDKQRGNKEQRVHRQGRRRGAKRGHIGDQPGTLFSIAALLTAPDGLFIQLATPEPSKTLSDAGYTRQSIEMTLPFRGAAREFAQIPYRITPDIRPIATHPPIVDRIGNTPARKQKRSRTRPDLYVVASISPLYHVREFLSSAFRLVGVVN